MSIKTHINAREWYEFFKALFVLYPSLRQKLSSELVRIDSPQLRYIIAALGNINEDSLIYLSHKSFSTEEDLAMIAKFAKEAHIESDIVEKILAGKSGKKMLPHLAENTTLSANDSYLLLHMNTNPNIKNFVARNVTSSPLIEALLSNKDANILEGLLHNRNISSESIISILDKLRFASPAILAASRNPNTPYDFLLEWSKNNDTSIQRTLSTNDAIPYEIQDILSSNADERTLINLARNPILDIEIQNRFLASLYTDSVRFSLAENSKLASSVAVQIFNSEIPALRSFAISKNPNISPSILAQIAADEDNKEVIKAIGAHPNVSSQTWEMLMCRAIKLGYKIDSFFLSPKSKEMINKYASHISAERKYLINLQHVQKIRKQSVASSNDLDYIARSIRIYQDGKITSEELINSVQRVFAI